MHGSSCQIHIECANPTEELLGKGDKRPVLCNVAKEEIKWEDHPECSTMAIKKINFWKIIPSVPGDNLCGMF